MTDAPPEPAGSLTVAVVGLWHLGSVTAACLARLGHRIAGYDKDPERTATLQDGRAPLFEPGLNDLLREGIASGRLRFTADFANAVAGADVVVVAYDTPVNEQDEVDTSVVRDAVRRAAPLLRSGTLVLVHSQVPVGTCATIRGELNTVRSDGGVEVACVPENLRLGQAIERFMHPDMLVVGAEDPQAHEVVDALFARIDAPRVRTNLTTAEMAKHAINAFLATSISFGNELAALAQTAGADGVQLAAILHHEKRVGRAPIDPGMGFAGGTLARDVKVLQGLGNSTAYRPYLMDAVLRANEQQNSLPLLWLRKIHGSLEGLHVGVLGLTYKAGTSTLRRSASLAIVRQLVAEGTTVAVADPRADLAEVDDLPPFQFSRDPYAAAAGADALLLVTPWPEFANLDYDRIRGGMRHPVLLDMPNSLDKERMERLGYVYVGVGRGKLVRLERA